MNRTAVAILVAMACVAFGVLPALALADIEGLKVSSTETPDTLGQRFPSTTEAVFVLFDYADASNEKLTVSLQGLGVPSIVAKTGTYNGSGSATVEIAGLEVLRSLVSQIAGYASQARDDARLAANQEMGRRGYIEQVVSDVAQVERFVQVLGVMPLDDDTVAQVDAVAESAGDLAALAEDASDSALDDAERKTKAEEMKDPADALVVAAEALADVAADIPSMAFPLTGESAPFTVQVQVAGSPSASTEFWVVESAYNPSGLNQAPSEATASAKATAQAGQSGLPTTTPGARSSGSTTGSTSGSGGTTAGGSGQSDSSTTGSAVSQPRAVMTAAARGSSAAGSGVAGESGAGSDAAQAPTAEGAGVVAESFDAAAPDLGAADGNVGADAPGAMPTWTVPALAMGGEGQAPPVQPVAAQGAGASGGSSGPNLAVLGLGALALVGVAVWLRSRM